MKLTHARDNGLTGLFVGLHTECRIFFCQLLQAHTEFVKVFLSLGFYGDTDNGIGEVHSLEHDGSVFGAQCVTGTDILEAYACAYIAAADHFLCVLLVGVHLEQTAHALFLTGT